MKEMPERIYLFDCNDAMVTPLEGDTEYIRKDIVDDMIKTAEDHAYFAGSEYARKEMVAKAVSWLENNVDGWIDMDYDQKAFVEEFKEAMGGE